MNKYRKENRIPLLMYHELYSQKCPELRFKRIHPSFCLSEEQFLQHIIYLKNKGYSTLTLKDIYNNNKILPDKSVIITFDDGYISNFILAFPILIKYNMTANFFMVVDKIGHQMYMNEMQLDKMAKNGMGIYSHTLNHNLLETLDEVKLHNEIYNSKHKLEKVIKQKVDYISYPDGSYNKNVIKIVKEAGYVAGCCSEPGYFNGINNSFYIPRFTVKSNWTTAHLQGILNYNMRYVYFLKISEIIKKLLRYLLGRNNYNLVYIKIMERLHHNG